MKYNIIERDSIHKLCRAVNDSIGVGWLPTGGLIVHEVHNYDSGKLTTDYKFAQAMVLDN